MARATSARTRGLLVSGLLLVGGLGVAGCASAGASPSHPKGRSGASRSASCTKGTSRVTVGGQSTLNATPDEVTISLGVQTQSPKAATAMANNAAKTSAVVKKLKADGVSAAHLQTSGLSLQPVYNNHSVITGYQVSNTLTVTSYDIATAGTLIDDATAEAGNSVRVNDVNLSLRDSSALLSQARAAAVRQAAAQATAMAKAAGTRLGPVCSLVDRSSQGQQVQPLFAASAGVPAGLPTAQKTVLEAGSEQVTANVTAIYELLPPRA